MFRWLALAILLTCLTVSGYYRHRAHLESGRIPRRSEGGLFLAVRLLVALPLFASILLLVFRPDWMEWASFALPDWVRWAGVGLGLSMIPVAFWVFRSLGSNVSETVLTKERHTLVTTGPYRWVRHPLYTMGILLLVALGLMLASWLVLLYAFIVLVLIASIVIPAEEVALVSKFGDAYRDYERRSGRLFPRMVGPSPHVPAERGE